MKRLACISWIALLLCAIGYAQNYEVSVISTPNTDGGFTYVANNPNYAPSWLVVDFPEFTGMKASVPLPFSTLLPARSDRIVLFDVHPLDINNGYHIKSSYHASLGNPDAVHDDSVAYRFPWTHGTKYPLTQGNHGSFTHTGENEYAFDFEMPEGTPILAARGGIVVETKQDGNTGGPSESYESEANYILVMHDDMTFSNYVHLQHNGVVVKPGQSIKTGELIGYSGNTGFSSGPHLHFDVRIAMRNGHMQSIPIRFFNWNSDVINPTEGIWYYASFDGLPPFPVSFGTGLSNEQFTGYKKIIPLSGNVEIRAEQIDSSYVLYIGNGTDRSVMCTYNLQLTQMQASIPISSTIRIPAKTEYFLGILQPTGLSAGFGYSLVPIFEK